MQRKLLTLARSIHQRLAARAQWLGWRSQRPGPLIWVHAASVGEAITMLPVLDRLRAVRAGLASMLTFTSPSVEQWPGPLGVERAGFLPLGGPGTLKAMVRHLQPRVVVFARGDLWPGLVAAATRYGAPVVLVAGTVRAGSSRLSAPARLALRRAYEAIRWAGAVAPADADRLCRLGVSRSAVHVTGDPRHDQVIERRVSLGPGRTILQWSGGDPVMVAGSTDARDEAILLEAFRHVANHAPNARLVMVPHVVDRDAIRRRRDTASALGIPSAFLEPGAPGQARLLWGMTTGTLPDLYLAADFAYVGGGMTPGRLHAVAEPAGLGIPVLFGSGGAADLTADAAALLTAGGGIAVPPHAAPVAIARHWLQWLQDRDGARRAGLAARATLRSGAADRCASVILGWCG